MPHMVLIKRKGGQVLLFEEFQYYKHTLYKNLTVKWRCSNWKRNKCPGTVTTEESLVMKKTEHKCELDPIRNERDKNVANLRSEVEKSDLSIPKLYDYALRELNDRGQHDIIGIFPELSSVKHSLYGARNTKAGVSKMQFTSLAAVEIPYKFKDFILGDYLHQDQRIILFCTTESRKLIGTVTEFFGDATFQSCPKPFSQLYTLSGDFGSSTTQTHVKPLIFALMPDKKEHTYYTIFEIIKLQLPQWNPSILHCDFELGPINAILKLFPTITIVGCYYHLGKCMWKHANLMGYDKSKPERRIVSLCAALPLLPKEMIEKGWEYINFECVVEIFHMQKFMRYVKKLG